MVIPAKLPQPKKARTEERDASNNDTYSTMLQRNGTRTQNHILHQKPLLSSQNRRPKHHIYTIHLRNKRAQNNAYRNITKYFIPNYKIFRLTPYSARSACFFSQNSIFLSQQFSQNSVFQPIFSKPNRASSLHS